MNTILIGDSNIFIDIIEARIQKQFFRLPFRIATPDILYHQELRDKHADLVDLGLELFTLDSSTVLSVSALSAKHRKPNESRRASPSLGSSRSSSPLF